MRRGWLGVVDRATGRGDPARLRSEAGDTLIEVLFAIVILGIASVALLIAFAASISASAVHRGLATFDTVIRSASQQAISQIQQQPRPALRVLRAARLLPDRGAGAVIFCLAVGLHRPGHAACSTGTAPRSRVNIEPVRRRTRRSGSRSRSRPTGRATTTTSSSTTPTPRRSPRAAPPTSSSSSSSPAARRSASPFTTQPVVRVEDSAGNVVTTDLSPVTLIDHDRDRDRAAPRSLQLHRRRELRRHHLQRLQHQHRRAQLPADRDGPRPWHPRPAISTPFNVYIQLTQPVITSLDPFVDRRRARSTSRSPGPPTRPVGQTYTATACANSGVGFGCVTQNNFTSGIRPHRADAGHELLRDGHGERADAAVPARHVGDRGADARDRPAERAGDADPRLRHGAPARSRSPSRRRRPPPSARCTPATACTNAAMTTGCVTGSRARPAAT